MSIEPSIPLSEFISNGNNINNLPTQIFKQLQNCKTELEVLNATVRIIYQALKCDRAVVYSLQPQSMYKIVAEAVTPGYAQILNNIIQDSCFETRYLEQYQKGRIRAITNIREAGMNPCYVESLAKLDVKSNLVVPIIGSNSYLYGLLVIHQCSRIRQWKQSEVEFVLQMADWLIDQLFQFQQTQELANKLENQQKAQQIITDLIKDLNCASSFDDVLQLGVNKAKSLLSCDRVVVYGLQAQSIGKITAEATVSSLAPILGSVIKDPCFEYRYLDQYQQGRIRAINNIYEAGMTSCYIDNLAKIGVKSNLVAPINWDNGEIYGLLVAHQCFDYKDWQLDEIECFKQIAFHTGLCLSKAQLKEETYSIQAEYAQLYEIKNSLTLAKSKSQLLKQSIHNNNLIFNEVENINKLLLREINLIHQNSWPQTQKDTKLIQIMIKKLAVITTRFKQSLAITDNSKNEVDLVIDEAISSISSNTIK
ncbi:methyl-accepting chemotaxis sensory transducer [Chondrocystis sp. NIES-4102]|nr:methyl-accepting chemotaxis sensory transducer [Chondrocystis sp. NIES-4102]